MSEFVVYKVRTQDLTTELIFCVKKAVNLSLSRVIQLRDKKGT